MTDQEPPYPVTDWYPMLHYGDETAEINWRIIVDIISHPDELITRIEACSGSNWGDDDIDAQLDILQDSGMITEIEYNGRTFYGLTDLGKQFVVDSQLYRGHTVLKAINESTAHPDDVQAAFDAERPSHPPTDKEYEEHDTNSEAWEQATSATFCTLRLELVRVDGVTYEATLVNEDDEETLAHREIEEPDADTEHTADEREMSINEPRGRYEEAAYDILVDRSEPTVKVKVAKNGEDIYDSIERCLYIFR